MKKIFKFRKSSIYVLAVFILIFSAILILYLKWHVRYNESHSDVEEDNLGNEGDKENALTFQSQDEYLQYWQNVASINDIVKRTEEYLRGHNVSELPIIGNFIGLQEGKILFKDREFILQFFFDNETICFRKNTYSEEEIKENCQDLFNIMEKDSEIYIIVNSDGKILSCTLFV